MLLKQPRSSAGRLIAVMPNSIGQIDRRPREPSYDQIWAPAPAVASADLAVSSLGGRALPAHLADLDERRPGDRGPGSIKGLRATPPRTTRPHQALGRACREAEEFARGTETSARTARGPRSHRALAAARSASLLRRPEFALRGTSSTPPSRRRAPPSRARAGLTAEERDTNEPPSPTEPEAQAGAGTRVSSRRWPTPRHARSLRRPSRPPGELPQHRARTSAARPTLRISAASVEECFEQQHAVRRSARRRSPAPGLPNASRSKNTSEGDGDREPRYRRLLRGRDATSSLGAQRRAAPRGAGRSNSSRRGPRAQSLLALGGRGRCCSIDVRHLEHEEALPGATRSGSPASWRSSCWSA